MRLLRICSAVAGFLEVGFIGSALAAAPQTQSLAGRWRFQLDREDAGITNRWFAQALTQKIQLPGALQNQGFGEDISVDTKWTGDVGADRWLKGAQYEPYRQPGNIKVPFFLQPEKHYVGAAWYQRDIVIPEKWRGQRVVLTLERPHWETRVWVDDRLIGTNDSLCTPHVYELSAQLAPGKHQLTIRVDNRIIVDVGSWSHSVSDHTQGNWNGLVGKIELSATAPVWIEDAQVFPNVSAKSARLKVKIANATGKAGDGTLLASLRNSESGSTSSQHPIRWTEQGGEAECEISTGDLAGLWDEFTPNLLRLSLKLSPAGANLDWQSEFAATFGLREISVRDRQFLLNGRPTFLRGTLECCIFPRTGYPPTDVESWKRIIRVCKEHGLNHIRFHSWCPPEAAFTAADQLGFYYSVECGVWTQPGSGQPIDDWIYRESERIVRAYGNHPSFVLLTHGNEPHGPKHQEFLAQWVSHWKEKDPRRLYTSGSAYPQLPENQYHVHHIGRGPSGWLGKDYRKQYDQYNVPIIIHEMGQWCVYPNFDEVKKYTGPLKPKNFDIFRDSLAAHGMLGQWRDFLRASGKLQALCYKEECEAALRTPGVGGVQLLDLHDFPGQGTALVGVLDPFWDSKGYITAAEFRRFYDTTVPLARLFKRAWTADETLTADVEIAHYGPAPLENAVTYWKVLNDVGTLVAVGEFPTKTVPLGSGTMAGQVSLELGKLSAPKAYKLVAGIKGTRFENDWNFWVYPPGLPEVSERGSPEPQRSRIVEHAAALESRAPIARTNQGGVITTDSLDTALAELKRGGKVLLATAKMSPAHPKLGFEPIFWNKYMFNTQGRTTLGLLCDPKHPALAQFPTEAWQDWQWHDIVTSARGVVLDELPKNLRPIVQPIDDWNSNRKLGLIFECRVGAGQLLCCAADLNNHLDKRPAARQLRRSLLAYVGSPRFKPAVAVAPEELMRVLRWSAKSTLANLDAKILSVSSEDREHGNLAVHLIDGNPETFWHSQWTPANDPMPHTLVIDIGREINVKGFTCLPRQDMAHSRVAECEFYLSNDPKVWGELVARGQWKNTDQLQTVPLPQPAKARYLKLVITKEIKNNPFAALAEVDVVVQ